MKKFIKVVAAIIENNDGEILCALRSPDMSIPNHWEFPGGKVENGEDIFSALKREIHEELQCKIEPFEVFHEHTHEYESGIVHLITIKAKVVGGSPKATEHSKIIWLKKENLKSLVWAPADRPAVDLLLRES